MQPVLMIGCGGSGTKAVRHVRAAVKRRLQEIGWEDELPACWQFIGIDTPNTQEASSEIPVLPPEDYLSIGARHKSYPALFRALDATWAQNRTKDAGLLSGWMPDPSKASFPLSKGAGQTRAIGRVVALDAFSRQVSDSLRTAFADLRGSRADLDKVTRALGYEVSGDSERSHQDPLVVVCTSIGGGTGAGISLDVVDALRAIDADGSHPVLVLFANDIFDLDTKDALAANSLAFLSEMMAAYWSVDGQIKSPMSVVQSSQNPGSGPHSVFLLSKEQHGGASFGSTAEIYLAAGEVLSTWVTSEIVQEQIVNFLVANWQNNASINYGGYPFGQNTQQSVVSSFGVAKVSIGRDRFARWAEHKLAKAAMESLVQGHLRHRSHRETHLTDEDWIIELGQKYASAVYAASGITDSDERQGLASIESFYVPPESIAHQQAAARQDLLSAVPSSGAMPAASMHEHLRNRAKRLLAALMGATDVETERLWRNQVAQDTCRAVSEIAAVTSLSVAQAAVDAARGEGRRTLAHLREKAGKSDREYHRLVEAGLDALRQASGNLDSSSEALQQAVDHIASGLSWAWHEKRLKAAAEMLDLADGEILAELDTCLKGLATEVSRSLAEDEVAEWPQAGDLGVSVKYHPSAVEFPIEDHRGWAGRLQALCQEAAEPNIPYGDLPIDPVRYRLVAGYKDDIMPMLRLRANASWTPGISAPIEGHGHTEIWIERFHQWSDKPGSTYRRFVTEGLRDYLAPNDPHTGQRRIDHAERNAQFRNCLLSAKERSKPMMRLSQELYHATHERMPEERFFRQMFPFSDGHPAAAIVNDVLGDDGWRSSLLDLSSVMLTSYFEFPVHPVVVSSLTEPIAAALASYPDPEKRSYSFWQWRRARRLDAFIPLPRVLLERMVRGFAIARMCGLITAHTEQAVEIIDPDSWESHSFPWPLLTRASSRADILALLLESFSLCFGKVNMEGLEAFAAYRALHEYGHRNELRSPGDALKIAVQDGPTAFRRLAEPTPHLRGHAESDRLAEALNYLQSQQERFVKYRTFNNAEIRLRDRTGLAQPGVPTGELADVYLTVYGTLERSLQESAWQDDEV